MKQYFGTALFIIISLTCISQSIPTGYVIKNDHDTLKGYFKDIITEQLTDKVQFKASLNEDWTIFLPGTIQGFAIKEGGLFKSITYIDDRDSNKVKTVFGMELMEGLFNVYAIYQSGKNYYFVQSKSDSGWLLYDDEHISQGLVLKGTYKNNLAFIARNCGSLSTEAAGVEFYEAQILGYVRKINNCLDPSTQVVTHIQSLKLKANFVIYAGGLTLGKNEFQVSIQGMSRITFPQVSRQLSVNIGFTYARRSVPGIYNTYITSYDQNYVYELYSIPLQFQYNFTHGMIQPYILAGFSYAFSKDYTFIKTYPDEVNKINGFEMLTGFGLEIYPIKNFIIKGEWRFEEFKQLPTFGVGFRF